MFRSARDWRRARRVIPLPAAPVQVVTDKLPGAVLAAGDISSNGLELELPTPLPVAVDDQLILTLHLPAQAAIRVDARVRHVDAIRLGVVFTDLPPNRRDAIQRYVSWVAGRPRWWQRLGPLWRA